MHWTWFLAALLLVATGPAGAQRTQIADLPALAGDYFVLDSEAARHRYHIHVRLPESYAANPTRRYPTV